MEHGQYMRKNTAQVFSQIMIAAFLLSGFAQAGEVDASVVVNPVGDFVAAFKDIPMAVVKNKDSYQIQGPVVIPWKKISTGMETRDKHALKFFNADKYPNIEITSTLGKDGKGVARVKFNNVEKIVKGTYKIEGKKLIAEVKIKLNEFNVKDINFKGAGVEDEVVIKTTADIP